jgi:hypothetical protein
MATRKQPARKGSMAKAAPNAVQQAAAQLAPAAAPAAPVAPAAAPATVALRGGQAVATVALTGAAYRTAAPHNQLWWAAISAALAAGPAPVAPLLASPANPTGVPAGFFGYCLRRGYLKAA